MKLESISNSAMSTYEGCPRQYFFSYVKGMWPEQTAPALAIGGAVHKVLAEMYKLKLVDRELTLDQALNVFAGELRSRKIKLKANDTVDKLTVQYREIINKVLNNPLDIEPVKIEYYFRAPFKNPYTHEVLGPKIKGVIDLVGKGDVLIEHKTSSSKYTPSKIYESKQHVLYYVAYWNLYHRKPSKIVYSIIYKTKNLNIDIFEVDVSKADVLNLFEWAAKIIRGIENEVWNTKPEYLKCKWCQYSNICPNAAA